MAEVVEVYVTTSSLFFPNGDCEGIYFSVGVELMSVSAGSISSILYKSTLTY